jgi:sec-independent protein translocase protein TatA
MGFGMKELIIILIIALVIFGARRLPEIGKAMGKAIREFKKSVKEVEEGVEGKNEEKSGKNEG